MAKFKVGDKVRIKEGAHGAERYSWGTPNGFQRIMEDAGVDFGDTVKISVEEDFYGEFGLSLEDDDSTFIYVFPQFLEHVEEEAPKYPVPMVVGGKYWNPEVLEWYTVTDIYWEKQVVYFKFGDGGIGTSRGFEDIETTFPGYCAPVQSEGSPALSEAEVEPETVSLSALEEAAKFLKAEDFLQDLLKLAKRLA